MTGRGRRIPSAVLAAAALTIALTACTGSNTDRTGGGSAHPPLILHMPDVLSAEEMQPFVDAVQRLSKGSISIDVEEHWHPTSVSAETELVRHVQAGNAPLGVVPARAWRRDLALLRCNR